MTHPKETLVAIAAEANMDIFNPKFAELMDSKDTLSAFRDRFYIPDIDAEKPELGKRTYMCGNSLGLQPKSAHTYVMEEMVKWAQVGVNGHFEGKRPWKSIEELVLKQSANIVGAHEDEVAVMNSLTVNLHLLMVAFYHPDGKRRKIILEKKAFPSDHYAVESQIKFHKLDPSECMVLLQPREGEHTLRTEDILAAIDKEGDELALVMLSGIQYYTGQLFEIEKITKAGHAVGAEVGFDLAHAAGNALLKLHDWGVDFACWCTYKYLNSGPGGIAGAFIHRKNAERCKELQGFRGWWGHNKTTRFQMPEEFDPLPGVSAFQLSNPCVLPIMTLLASLEIFEEAGGIAKLREKSLLLTAYLEALIHKFLPTSVRILTPSEVEQRGCQLSIEFLKKPLSEVQEKLEKAGVICDERKPTVTRVAPTPLYNMFQEVRKVVDTLVEIHQGVE